jgi:hypothetical protein
VATWRRRLTLSPAVDVPAPTRYTPSPSPQMRDGEGYPVANPSLVKRIKRFHIGDIYRPKESERVSPHPGTRGTPLVPGASSHLSLRSLSLTSLFFFFPTTCFSTISHASNNSGVTTHSLLHFKRVLEKVYTHSDAASPSLQARVRDSDVTTRQTRQRPFPRSKREAEVFLRRNNDDAPPQTRSEGSSPMQRHDNASPRMQGKRRHGASPTRRHDDTSKREMLRCHFGPLMPRYYSRVSPVLYRENIHVFYLFVTLCDGPTKSGYGIGFSD